MKLVTSGKLLRICVNESFVGKVLDLVTDLILLEKGPRSSLVFRRTLFACFPLFSCLITDFQRATGKLQIVSTASRFLKEVDKA